LWGKSPRILRHAACSTHQWLPGVGPGHKHQESQMIRMIAAGLFALALLATSARAEEPKTDTTKADKKAKKMKKHKKAKKADATKPADTSTTPPPAK